MNGADRASGHAAGVRVLVVDDQDVFRSVMCELVAATPGMTLAGEASSGEAALDAIAELEPAMVIMDKRMPGMGGVEATRILTSRHPGIVVILVSVEPPDEGVQERCGATAFLRKQMLSPRTLADVWQARSAAA